MKKNILIIGLLLITAFSMFYAGTKATEAEKAFEQVVIYQKEAEKEKERADAQALIALDNAAEAHKAMAEAEHAIQECQSK